MSLQPPQKVTFSRSESAQLLGISVRLASVPDPKNTLDLDSLCRLRSFFELLDRWDQEENADEE